MSSLHPARRSAERFNAMLDSEQEAARDARHSDLLELVGALRAVPAVEARPEFVSDLRERLMLAAETELVVPDSPAALTERLTVRSRRTPRERRLAVALGGIAIVGATTSMAVAAQSAIPGDVLYPLKRAIENAEAGFSVSDEAKGSTILENASGRLDEVDRLTHEDDVDAAVVSETLTTFAEQATEASELLMADYEATGSEDSINELRDFTAASIETLSGLEQFIPAAAQQALQDAAQTVFEIDTLAATLCPLCESLGIIDIPGQLLASGDARLDQAAIDLASTAAAQQPAKPGGNKNDQPGGDDKGPITQAPTDSGPTEVDDPVQLPTQGSGGNDNGDNTPHNPLPSGGVSIPTSVPTLGVPQVDGLVSEVVEGVNGVVGGLTGTGK